MEKKAKKGNIVGYTNKKNTQKHDRFKRASQGDNTKRAQKVALSINSIEDRFNSVFDKALNKLDKELQENKTAEEKVEKREKEKQSYQKPEKVGAKNKELAEERKEKLNKLLSTEDQENVDIDLQGAIRMLSRDLQAFKQNTNKKLDIIISTLRANKPKRK